ncbi:hypothetical protein [Mesoflavibacter zeaxanthinifaciens]|uniref:hypothetical protein n=1 Tax=Mesoflavibacter zeaxanthinifaciens TaxID=393060 RepID=UPI003A94F284
MKKKVLSILLVIMSFSVFSQEKGKNRIDEEFPPSIPFPYDYLGNYEGNTKVVNNEKVLSNIPTSFVINKSKESNVFDYKIIFKSGKAEEVYVFKLIIIDETKGFYVVKDSDNNEYLATLIDNQLHVTYTKDNFHYLNTIQFTNSGKMYFIMTISELSKSIKKTKTAIYNTVLLQKATLSKSAN